MEYTVNHKRLHGLKKGENPNTIRCIRRFSQTDADSTTRKGGFCRLLNLQVLQYYVFLLAAEPRRQVVKDDFGSQRH